MAPNRYLKSTTTGVVLPFNETTLRVSPHVIELSAHEAMEYEKKMGVRSEDAAPPPVAPAPEPIKEAAPETVKVAKGVVASQDISDGEPDVQEVLSALEVE